MRVCIIMRLPIFRSSNSPPDDESCRHSWHLYGLRLNLDRLDITRAQFIQELRRKNICASVHFIPIPLLSFFAPYADLGHNRCPNALALYPRLVSLPLYPAMTERQVLYVAQAVKEIVWNCQENHSGRRARGFWICNRGLKNLRWTQSLSINL